MENLAERANSLCIYDFSIKIKSVVKKFIILLVISSIIYLNFDYFLCTGNTAKIQITPLSAIHCLDGTKFSGVGTSHM